MAFPPGPWVLRGMNEAQRAAVVARFGGAPAGDPEEDAAEVRLLRGDPSAFLPTPMVEMRFDVEAGPADVGAAGPGW